MPDGRAQPLLGAPELAVHVFVPTGGPHAGDLYAYLRHIWDGCRSHLGMTAPITPLGVPSSPPPHHQPDPTQVQAGIAAQRHTGVGVFQSLLRRDHDVLCLSAMLASPPESGVGWAELSRMWAQVSEPVPDGLLGTAELYLARLTDPEPDRVKPSAALGAACRQLLPAPTPHPDFDGLGTATAGGFAVWEVDRSEEARLLRRIVVVAAHGRDAELSAWTWTRGGSSGLAVTPFARYLMHAAKLRYHLRIWAGGAPVRALRGDADRAVAAVATQLGGRGTADDTPSASVHLAGQRLVTLRRQAYHLATAAADLREMRHSIDIAATNMASYADPAPTRGEHPATGAGWGLFADDRGLASWFADQLDDDHFYLAAALDRARETLDAAALAGGRADQRTAGHEPAPGQDEDEDEDNEDIVLTAPERASLLQALARAFVTDTAAEAVLSPLGFGRERRPNLDQVPPASGWAEILSECDHGAVRAPYRRILAAALARYPYNPVFRGLARHHGVEAAEFDDPDP